MAPTNTISIRGAREHNLKNVDLDIPRDQLVVITGPSGSGKSSLAFDTVYAEGQRKYMESLSAYARQFLDQLRKPDMESIEGLPPTIAIQQRSGGHNPRSTVATTTEIWDYLRLLFARAGTPTCWHVDKNGEVCGRPITGANATQITDALQDFHEGTRMLLMAPVIRAKKGHHREVLEELQGQGVVRVRVNGTVHDLRDALREGGANPLGLARYEMHNIEAVLDRVVIKSGQRDRLADSVEACLRLGDGSLIASVENDGQWTDHPFSESFACELHPECSLPELEPRMFSFNSPFGACPVCEGLGRMLEYDEELVVPDPSVGYAEAIEPWRKNGPRMNRWYARMMRKFCDACGLDRHLPYSELPAKVREVLMHGGEIGNIVWPGVIPSLKSRHDETESDAVKERLQGYMRSTPCKACGGQRLKPASLGVRLGAEGPNIAEVAAMSIVDAVAYFDNLTLGEEGDRIAAPILKEVKARLGFMQSVGLGYLTLDRASNTLSGGEAQRIRLATQVGSGLVGCCYVLDEPTIGLHQRDNERLLQTLRHLTDIGNTVVVVEHDEDTIRAADHLVDIGPAAGVHGGTVVAEGTPAQVTKNKNSLTGDYLSGRRGLPTPEDRRPLNQKSALVVKNARGNNLQGIDATFPLGGLVCVTGVSGSGKSTLVNQILLRAVRRHLGGREHPLAHDRVNGLSKIDRLVEVDQSPIGRTSRSNPATYTGIFDEIRKVFAKTTEARLRGYEVGRFSFNVKGGRCEACQGQGVKTVEMHFLPDVQVTCEVCQGKRYNRETLEVTYRGKTIADILEMTIEDAVSFFEAHPKILRMAECLRDVGLGYLTLGQPATTLSGGEAQRVKLAAELGRRSNVGHTLYVLDEPTTGLHFLDVERLLNVLQRLADTDASLIVIEHNLDVIRCADWVIDLGPEGGSGGGTIVGQGVPEEVAQVKGSHTGRFLGPLLKPKAPTQAKRTKKVASKTTKAAKKTTKKSAKKSPRKKVKA
ncbi:MAG: excinuclease ABC subunit UvrA [Planctomycetota bacterium]|nr:MAG: excinuclease ABC subunit UvrA [Phycisphaeraceae bacterium]